MLLLSLVAAAAMAAPGSDSVGSRSEPELVHSVHQYASCIAQQRTSTVRTVLAMDFRSAGYQRAIRHLNLYDRDCESTIETRRGWESSGLIFAGALAEELLRRDFAGRDLAPLVAYDPARPPVIARSPSEVMAICIVRGDPREASRLLATEPATDGELAALRDMSALLSSCAPRGQSRFTRESLRAIIALAALRLATIQNAG